MSGQGASGDFVRIICEKIFETVLRGEARVSTCAQFRVSCEGWLKVELLVSFLSFLAREDVDFCPELDKVDLTISSSTHRVLLELKTFPTNYGASKPKPITDFINGVIENLDKLSRMRDNDTGLVAWLAYPIPDPVPSTWPSHFARVERAAARTLLSERVELLIPNTYANLSIMESK